MTRRFLLLIRHAISEKNVRGQFSGGVGTDQLASNAQSEMEQLVSDVRKIMLALDIRSTRIAHAPSQRARATALSLLPLCDAALEEIGEFRSIRSGIAAGLTEAEIEQRNPEFSVALKLYRAGLLSSYDIPYPAGAEAVDSFEAVVVGRLNQLLSTRTEQLQIVVAHRSPITAMLINYARTVHRYPVNFFGFVPLDTCATSCVETTKGAEHILWVNRSFRQDTIPKAELAGASELGNT